MATGNRHHLKSNPGHDWDDAQCFRGNKSIRSTKYRRILAKKTRTLLKKEVGKIIKEEFAGQPSIIKELTYINRL